MTAEISIMNKRAIALAADSAVTIETRDGKKIFNTVNKLFMLSKYHPVGIMIYGNAELMNIPWETTIKTYRKRLGNKRFDELKDYADDFINYLDNGNGLFPSSQQEEYFAETVFRAFYTVRSSIDKKIKEEISRYGGIDDLKIKRISTKIIRDYYNVWFQLDTVPTFPKNHHRVILQKYKELIEKLKNEVFQKLPLSINAEKLLTNLCAYLFIKKRFSSRSSGVVIAGFGEAEIFPSLRAYVIEGIISDKLKFEMSISQAINYSQTALIMPFAQGEMVSTFMEGIDPYYKNIINGFLTKLFEEIYPNIIVKTVGKKSKTKNLFEDKLKQVGSAIISDFREKMDEYKEENHVNPILNVVAVLPKDELAAMAESFINLTSLKRKISMDAETVGGPIDVAVISKGDGFIWIKRKHYFKKELNPNFFANYFS